MKTFIFLHFCVAFLVFSQTFIIRFQKRLQLQHFTLVYPTVHVSSSPNICSIILIIFIICLNSIYIELCRECVWVVSCIQCTMHRFKISVSNIELSVASMFVAPFSTIVQVFLLSPAFPTSLTWKVSFIYSLLHFQARDNITVKSCVPRYALYAVKLLPCWCYKTGFVRKVKTKLTIHVIF